MTSISAPSAQDNLDRAQIYSAHLQTSLLPDLEVTRQALVKVEQDISEYEDLQSRIDELGKVKEKEIETLSELGAGVWVETRISATENITLDLGFDLHMDMTLSAAREYIIKKLDVLKKKRDSLSKKEEFLVWQVAQFHGALSQPNAPSTAAV